MQTLRLQKSKNQGIYTICYCYYTHFILSWYILWSGVGLRFTSINTPAQKNSFVTKKEVKPVLIAIKTKWCTCHMYSKPTGTIPSIKSGNIKGM